MIMMKRTTYNECHEDSKDDEDGEDERVGGDSNEEDYDSAWEEKVDGIYNRVVDYNKTNLSWI